MGPTPLPSIAGRVGAALLAIGLAGIANAQPDLDAVHPTLRSILTASGLDDAERRVFEARFDDLAKDVASRVGTVRSPERRARALHRVLHARVFVRYQDYADGIDDVLARGDFNCVSSTLLEGLLASSLGLNASIVPGPQHVFLRLALPKRVVDVETTVRNGFDVRSETAVPARRLLEDGGSASDGLALRDACTIAEHEFRLGPEVQIEDGAAFVWHNAAGRALARGEGRLAAERLLAGETRYPGVALGGESLQSELSHAFRVDYDAARFDDAYASAVIGVRLGPGVVSAHDRLIAAAVQRVERLVDLGDVVQAEGIVVELRELLGDNARRFERHVLPLIVAAAVRVGDWERADRLAASFGSVELDPVEVSRLRGWVRDRQIESHPAR